MKGWVQQTPGILEHSETIIHNFKYLKESKGMSLSGSSRRSIGSREQKTLSWSEAIQQTARL